jgi:hypothetical protein
MPSDLWLFAPNTYTRLFLLQVGVRESAADE